MNATLIGVRVPPAELAPIDAWIKEQPKPRPSRPEAIRRLVEIGLNAKPVREPSAKVVDKAATLAAKVIEERFDHSAPAEERERRLRRLTKGPLEFQDLRRDRPKAKR